MPLDESYDTVPVITYGRGDDYRSWDVTKVKNFKKLADLVELETGEKVEYIDYRDPKDVYIKIPTTNIRLGSMSPAIFNKISRLPSLLPCRRVLMATTSSRRRLTPLPTFASSPTRQQRKAWPFCGSWSLPLPPPALR